MSLRTISRSALDGYVKLVRLPFDAVAGLRTRNGRTDHSSATIGLDRFEASLRALVGRTFRDEGLLRDAERMRLAADERERADGLRGEARRRSERAEQRLSRRVEKTGQQRRQATRRAADRKKRAEQQSQAESRRIANVESRRRRANETATARKAKADDARAKRARLRQLDEDADALAKKQSALTARSESRRLRSATGKAKAARKRGGR